VVQKDKTTDSTDEHGFRGKDHLFFRFKGGLSATKAAREFRSLAYAPLHDSSSQRSDKARARRRIPIPNRRPRFVTSEPPHQEQDDDDHHDDAEQAAGGVTPTPAVPPRGESSDKKEDQDDEEDGSDGHDGDGFGVRLLLCRIAAKAPPGSATPVVTGFSQKSSVPQNPNPDAK
jgi:hypothetical protein